MEHPGLEPELQYRMLALKSIAQTTVLQCQPPLAQFLTVRKVMTLDQIKHTVFSPHFSIQTDETAPAAGLRYHH